MTDLTRTRGTAIQPADQQQAEQIRAYLAPHLQSVLDKTIELAKAGDQHHTKLFLAYVSPPLKPAEKVAISGIESATTMEEKGIAILHAATTNVISAEAGERLLRLLGTYASVCLADKHSKEIDELKRQVGGGKSIIDVHSAEDLV